MLYTCSKSTSGKMRLKRLKADSIIKNNVFLAMGAGLIPMPFVDMVAITSIELKMIHELARAYTFRFPTQMASYKVLISLIGGLGPVYFSDRFHSTFKTVPLVGHAVASVLLSLSGGASVYAVGWAFRKHFESGGTFLNSDSRTLRKYFRDKYREGRTMIAQLGGESAPLEPASSARATHPCDLDDLLEI